MSPDFCAKQRSVGFLRFLLRRHFDHEDFLEENKEGWGNFKSNGQNDDQS